MSHRPQPRDVRSAQVINIFIFSVLNWTFLGSPMWGSGNRVAIKVSAVVGHLYGGSLARLIGNSGYGTDVSGSY